MVELIKLERDERKQHFEEIKDVIGNKIEEIAEANGNITRPAVEKLFDDFSKRFQTSVTEKIDTVVRNIVAQNSQNSGTPQTEQLAVLDGDGMESGRYPIFNYNGKLMQVPKDFMLPTKVKRKKAWELWVCGMVTGVLNDTRIRPFLFFKLSMLPKKVQTKFKTEWQPILRKMEAGVDIILPMNGDLINAALIDKTFRMATNHLKANVCSFLWEKKHSVIENWSVASWSSSTQRAYILKNGNSNDINNLPTATRYNRAHKEKRTLKRKRGA